MANNTILFTIPGDPVAQGRPRFARIWEDDFCRPVQGKRSGRVVTYDPEQSKVQKEAIALMAKPHGMMEEGPLEIEMTFYRKIPQSWSKARKLAAESGEIVPTTRPDLDNYVKLVLDALNKVSFADDSAIVDLITRKRYSLRPRTVVLIRRWQA